jgi:hypothetical protein
MRDPRSTIHDPRSRCAIYGGSPRNLRTAKKTRGSSWRSRAFSAACNDAPTPAPANLCRLNNKEGGRRKGSGTTSDQDRVSRSAGPWDSNHMSNSMSNSKSRVPLARSIRALGFLTKSPVTRPTGQSAITNRWEAQSSGSRATNSRY